MERYKRSRGYSQNIIQIVMSTMHAVHTTK